MTGGSSMPDRSAADSSTPVSPMPPTASEGQGRDENGSDENAAMLHRAIGAFAEALAATPEGTLAHRQPRPAWGNPKPKPAMRRDVLVDAITAAGDLLQAMEAPAGTPEQGEHR